MQIFKYFLRYMNTKKALSRWTVFYVDPAIINNIKKALHRSFRTDEICNVVFHISQLNTPYYRDKYDLLSPSFVPLDSVSQSMYN